MCSKTIVRELKTYALLTTVLLCSASQSAGAQERDAAARASLERIQTLRNERPHDGVLAFYEAVVRVNLGERDAALNLLRSLKGRKLGIIPVRDMGFAPLWDDAEFQAIRKELADEEPRTSDSPIAFRLKDPKLIPEGIAYDADGHRFFVSSVAQGKIIVTDGKGEVRDFSKPSDKLDCVLGLKVDSAHASLYAVTSNGFLNDASRERRNAVVRYDLKNGQLQDRFGAPEAMQLNDLVVAPDGTLYVTDSMNGSLFRKKPNEFTLTRLGEKGALPGANGIALDAAGALYIAISTGIAQIDTANGKPTRLPQPDSIVTAAIDGLYWYEGDLIGVQNATNPGRVIRLALADRGSRIAGLTVLQSHQHPDFDEPTTGAIATDNLYVIGNSYVSHYQPDGTITEAEALKPTAIIAVPLHR